MPDEVEAGTTLASEIVHDGRVVRLSLDTVRLPGGAVCTLETIRHAGAAAVLPLAGEASAPDPVVVLLRQYRHAAGGFLYEIPAGVREPGETFEACARRELEEETGMRADSLRFLTTILTTPGFTDERIGLFVASGLRPGRACPDPDEVARVERLPLSRALELARTGVVSDAKTLVALMHFAGFLQPHGPTESRIGS